MKITDLRRNNLRYIMFRLKTGASDKSRKLTAKELKGLLSGWGFDVSVSKAAIFLADIKNHYEAALYFTGWENFAAEVRNAKTGLVRGTNKSWDIGMIDGDGSPESRIRNIARMVNRPNKWFLFSASYLEVVPTRGLENGVTRGLDYFTKQELTQDGPVLRDVRLYPDQSGASREFNYGEIYNRGLNNGTYH